MARTQTGTGTHSRHSVVASAVLFWTASINAWAGGALGAGVCQTVTDYVDPLYGGLVRQLVKPDGHEHNLYYYRDPWNADLSRMVGVQSDLEQKNWRVVLYDGNGCYLKDLFPITAYDWRVVWDRADPAVLYTLGGNQLYRYNVEDGAAELLKSFAPHRVKPAGLSLSQSGDRILALTSDNVFRSYRLVDMQEERTFTAEYPAGCTSSGDKERYIGYRNYIVTACVSPDSGGSAVLIYDDTGELFHRFEDMGGGGHHDFSCDGKWAYFKLWSRTDPLEIHVVNLDGSDDRVVMTVPAPETRFLQNLHLAWPRGVSDWFIASFFPNAKKLPERYAPYLDEIVQIGIDGTYRILARSETAYSAATSGSGGAEDMFWAQPLARPSSDGSRVNFNSNRSGTIDQMILYLDPGTVAEAIPGGRGSAGTGSVQPVKLP